MFVGMGANGAGGYNLTDSLRFRASASASLERTPTTTGNQKTFTASFWIKRGLIVDNVIMSSGETGDGDADLLQFHLTNQSLRLATATTQLCLTNAVLRDPSSWYHVVLAVDTTQATASNRIKIYLNNVLLSFSASSMPAQNTNFGWNKASNRMKIARAYNDTGHFDGYMTEINFVDGQALTPSDFGETDTDTGVWKPKKYTGTYGTNGFYLDMSTSGSTVTDQSGNGNDWTATNMNLTTSTATTYDIMSDVSTLTDEDTGNYAVMNPLIKSYSAQSWTLTNGNLQATDTGSGGGWGLATISATSGKWYWEGTVTANAKNHGMGWTTIGNISFSYNGCYQTQGNVANTSGGLATTFATYTTNDVIGVAVDVTAGKVWFSKNGTFLGSGDPVAGTNPAFTFTGGTESAPTFCFDNVAGTSGTACNFGQRPFVYTPPTGYKKLNTYNLPDSSIKDGSQYFTTVLYTGDGSTNRTISVPTLTPDFTWIKARSIVDDQIVYDTVRQGLAGAGARIKPNSTEAESDLGDYVDLITNGFKVSTGTYNNSGVTFASWNWKAGGTAVSNTNGTITSTVSANPTAGFSIVTYTGDGSNANKTVGHGLGVAPEMVIVKTRSEAARHWLIWHKDLTNYDYALLFNTDIPAANRFGPNAPTSSVFGVYGGQGNRGTETFVAYCFASVEGFSKMGSYTGNGSTDGPFVYTGFRPAFIIFKRTDTTSDWNTIDTARNTYNLSNLALRPNTSGAESTYTTANSPIDFISNGFKLRGTGGDSNASGGTYIYMAFAESPFKNSLAR